MKKRLSTRTSSKQRGFTLVEVLVVVAIVGVLSAVAVPMVSMFIGEGKTEAQITELHNVETAVTALLAKTADGQLNGATWPVSTNDMYTVTADVITDPTTDPVTTETRSVAYYMTGLDVTGYVDPLTMTSAITRTGCSYEFQQDGRVTDQSCP
ncbi:MAG TPA: prepilin-type N-terminal cleavage/methylation domain-containing protein [Dehalococcoidia bacterium]|nr:prepilin-type N-terminal cleavage/methylation domain-containing protein [Dehalococcoidia bacterium]